jgi:hypothetical protein
VADWVTISALATAGGTLALAAATFASTRSANRAARAAEQSLLEGLRPLLLPTRPEDPPQSIGFADERILRVEGGEGAAEVGDDAVYFGMGVRNVGSGIAVLHGWWFFPSLRRGADEGHAPLEDLRRLTRDLYIASGDVGFWQGALRDPDSEEFRQAKEVIESGLPFTVDLLYGDHAGGQRTVTRFALLPSDGRRIIAVGRHWNIDRPDPR